MPGAIFQSGCPKGSIPGEVGCEIPGVRGIIGSEWKNPAVDVAELVPGVVTAGSCCARVCGDGVLDPAEAAELRGISMSL